MSGSNVTVPLDRRSDETGAVAIVGALFLVVALLGAALAVDIGNQVYNQRELRKVVDLAALDAIRAVGDRQGEVTDAQGDPLTDQEAAVKLARDSAIANGYDLDLLDESFDVCIGVWDPDASTFHPSEDCPAESRVRFGDPTDEAPNAVGVAADDFVTFRFAGEGREISADSVASLDRVGGIAAGSRLASVSAGAAREEPDDVDELEDLRPLTDPLIDELFGGDEYGFDAEALSYEWLASTSVRLGDLAAEMGFGSAEEMLDAEVTGDEVFEAMIATAEADGQVEGGGEQTVDQIDSALDAGWEGETSFRLGDRMEVSSATAADVEWNLMDLFLGTLQLANGDNLIDTDLNLGLDLGDVPLLDGEVTARDLSLVVIEPPDSAFGPVGIDVETAQMRARLDLDVDVSATVAGTDVALTGVVPVHADLAGATATLTAIGCGAEPTLTMAAETHGADVWVADVTPPEAPQVSDPDHWAELALTADTTELLDLLGDLTDVLIETDLVAGTSTIAVRTFGEGEIAAKEHDPLTFHPDFDWDNTQTVSSTEDGHVDLTVSTDPSGVEELVEPVLEELTTLALREVLDPALRAIGADLAEADITGWHHECDRRALVR